ncbi:MAG: hypothetical protein WCV85_00160 [Patescibacteria group bacterium]|jgi:hypothetical protein
MKETAKQQRVTLCSQLLRNFAESKGISSLVEFAARFGFPRATVYDWWHGITVPSKMVHRDALYKLIPHELFQGFLTKEVKQKLLASPIEEQPGKIDSMDVAADRVGHLIPAILPDLIAIVTSPAGRLRAAIRKKVGSDQLFQLSVATRALSSETTLQKLLEDGELEKLQGGTHGN